MNNEEAREILGYRKNDVLLKTGLGEFKKAYKRWLKQPDTPNNIREAIKRDLEAVEILMNGGD